MGTVHGSRVLLELLIVLGTAAVTTVLFQVLRQPVALGYIVAGLVIGPNVPVPLVVDAGLIATLSELGVILLMFSIGLEFSIRTIARVGLGAAATALVEVGLMVTIGFLVGIAFGWSNVESLFLGACVGISSTMLVAKAFEEHGLKGPFTELVFAILVFEDLIAIVLLAVLTAVATGHSMSATELADMLLRLGGFLVVMLLAGLLVVPRAIRMVARLERGETLLITSLAVCFGMAALAAEAGYSVALGAFVAGMLIAESGRGHDVDEVIRPFRDVFAAIFFVSVGISIDPALLVEHAPVILVLTATVIVGKSTGVTVASFLAGNGLPRSVRAGMTLSQIGEFSFIIAGVGIAGGAVGGFLLPVAVGVSCLTAFATPWLVKSSDRVARAVDARLPQRLQTFVTFYGSWIERLRATPRTDTFWARLRRPLVTLLVDSALLAAVVIGASVAAPRLAPRVADSLAIDAEAARVGIVVAAVLVAGLFLIGVIRNVRRLANLLATEVVPRGEGGLDLGGAPRRVLFVTLELLIVLLVGLPLAALIQPFVAVGGTVLAFTVIVLSFAIWRATSNLHGHVRAGSELIVEALARQGRRAPTVTEDESKLEQVEAMLPGFAGLAPFVLDAASPAVGRTLAELNLRATTGASVLAITREGGGTAYPSPTEQLRAGDVLALAGSADAVAAARALLAGEAG